MIECDGSLCAYARQTLFNVNWPRLLPSAEAKIYQERGGKTKHEKSNEEV